MKTEWLAYAKQLQAIAQAGLEYSTDPYDQERFRQIREIAVDIVAKHTSLEHQLVTDLFANESGYQTPKVDVRGAVFRDNKILMVRESGDGSWSLPGGWADIELSVKENVEKEIFEEAGVKAKALRLIGVLDRNKHVDDGYPYSVYKVFVQCQYVQGDFIENIETCEARFFSLEELPPLSHSRINYEQIKMCFDAKDMRLFEAVLD